MASRKQLDVISLFRRHVLEHGQYPVTVFRFCKDIGMEESDFYDRYTSFDVLDQLIWERIISNTLSELDQDEAFETYSIQERILTFYYTQLDELKQNRSYIMATAGSTINPLEVQEKLRLYQKKFDAFFERLMAEGINSGDIISTKYLASQYYRAFALHNVLLIKFWMNDRSVAFERTDAVVEKSVNVIFDLIGQGTLDNVIDFLKFMLEGR